MAVDLIIFQRLQNGLDTTSQLKSQILNDVKFDRDIYNSKLASYGVPDNIVKLLQISKKSEAIKYCKNVTFSEFELFLFIKNCHLIGFSHKSKFPDYVPDHLVILDSDTEKFKTGDFKPVAKKLGPLLDERRHINVHLFCRDAEWHCFFFSYDDVEKSDNNHWKYGSHLHYISYLWPSYSKKIVWDSFDIRKTKLSGNIHIKLNPYQYPIDINSEDVSPHSLCENPSAYIFDSNFISECGCFPVPSAHIETRGCWIVTVSTLK